MVASPPFIWVSGDPMVRDQPPSPSRSPRPCAVPESVFWLEPQGSESSASGVGEGKVSPRAQNKRSYALPHCAPIEVGRGRKFKIHWPKFILENTLKLGN